MKKVRLHLFLTIIFTFSTLILTAQKTEYRDLKDFSGIKVIGEIRCEIYASEDEKVEIIAQNTEIENIITEIIDNILIIRLRTNTPREAEVKVKINYKNLEILEAQARSLIINNDTLSSKNIDFTCVNGGKMELIIHAESLSADVKQGSIIVFSGIVGTQEINVSSGGTYSAYKLKAQDTYVKAVAGGKAKVTAHRIIDATANAKAFIGYQGDPVSSFIKTNFGGEIQHIREIEE